MADNSAPPVEVPSPSSSKTEEGEKTMRRVQVKMRKKLPVPYVVAPPEGTITRSVCDATTWTQSWPLKLVCQREPAWPLTYTTEQRAKGCVLFWDRYMELWQADGHTTQSAVAAWEVYDTCMAKPTPREE